MYTGTRVNALTELEENDSASGLGQQSRVTLRVTAGTTYRIRVAGDQDARGRIVLNWVLVTAPANDLFSNAITISGRSGSTTGTNFGGFRETGEPGGGLYSVWWQWQAPQTGEVQIDTAGSTFDTILGVYTGTRVNALTELEENDSASGLGQQSRVTLDVTAGTTYRIRVAGDQDARGRIVLNWVLVTAPANDLFSNAITISGRSGNTTGTNFGGSRETGEPGGGLYSVWWQWQAPQTGEVQIDTAGSTFDTILGVYTGTRVNALTELEENDSASGLGQQSRVTLDVTAGTTYRIRVAGDQDARGRIVLNWNLGTAPANDLFSNAISISGRSGNTTGSNVGASRETGEPGSGDPSVWWHWQAPLSGEVSIDTAGSGFDTTLGVYTGTGDGRAGLGGPLGVVALASPRVGRCPSTRQGAVSTRPWVYTGTRVSALTKLAENNDGSGLGRQSRVTLNVTAGTTYRLRVAGHNGATGSIVLNWNLGTAPANDLFSNAITISGRSGNTTGSNVGASRETGEPGSGDPSVWWHWQALLSGEVSIDTAGSGFDTTLGVYTGTRVSALTKLAENNDGSGLGRQSRVTLNVTAGTTYRLRVAGHNGATGSIVLNWNLGTAPANDLFSNAITISGRSGSTTGSNGGASRETGEPGSGNPSVWWHWQAPQNGEVSIDTAGSSFDTTLGVYTGTRVSTLTRLAENNDGSGIGRQSRVTLNVTAGTTYRLRVAGHNGATGSIVLNWNLGTAPANDLFSNAITISELSARTTGSNVGATVETGEPGSGNHSVWWRWQVPQSGEVSIDTAGSSFDTTLGVYTGTRVSTLTRLAENNDGSGIGRQSRVTLNVTAGTTYRLRVAGHNGATGSIVLHWNLLTAPANDLFSDAITISGRSGSTMGNNFAASRETGEPGSGNPSVWWHWQAPQSGEVYIDTAGSSFNTTLGVYTGPKVSTLTRLAENDDAGGRRQSRVTLIVTAGTTYRLRVAGHNGATGSIVLNWNLGTAPANDLFSNAITISGRSGSTMGSNFGATVETGEPGIGTHSVWWQWQAPQSGEVSIDTAGSSFDTTLGVYTGTRVSTLTRLAENDDASGIGRQSRVTLNVTAGMTYRLRVAGNQGATGSIVLNWNLGTASANDLFSNAITISGRSGSTMGSNFGATVETGEPGIGTHSVWWHWQAPQSGEVSIDTAGSSFDTTLGVYTGTRVSALTRRAENDDASGIGRQSRVTLNVTAGMTYRLRVAGNQGATGSIVLNWNLGTASANDLFSNAITISGRSGSTMGSNFGATVETGEPGIGTHSVWWHWQAPQSGEVSIDTAGSSFDTTLGVYTGTRVSALTRRAENDDASGIGRQSRVTLNVTAGMTYRLRVAGNQGATGSIVLNWNLGTASANDLFSNAITISGRSGSTTGYNFGADRERFEPGNGDPSVWWQWQAPQNGEVTISTAGSSFNTTLGVYTGTRVSALTSLAENNDARGIGRQSRVTLNVTAGTTYRLRVAGYGWDTGSIVLNWSYGTAPANDLFSNAITISGRSGSTTGSNGGASRERGEPGIGHPSVWWLWQAPQNGEVTIGTAGSRFNTTLGVYTGPKVSELTRLAENDDASGLGNRSRVTLTVTAGVTYWLRVAGHNGPTGIIVLDWNLETGTPPANDLFSKAITISGQSGNTTGSNVGASRETREPGSGNLSVWWQWQASQSGELTIDTIGSDLNTTLGVYTGSRVDALTRLAENDNADGRQSRVVVGVTGGTVYKLRVAGWRYSQGDIVLNWNFVTPMPPNDLFANGATISGVLGRARGNNLGATVETGEPGLGTNSVWWQWQAPYSGTVTFETTDSVFDTTLGVYTGSRVDALARLTENDNADGRQDRVVVDVTAGTVYRLRVAGHNGAMGVIFLAWNFRPTNDLFSNAAAVSGRSGRTTGTNRRADVETGEPGFGFLSVWWQWQAPQTGEVTIDTEGSSFDTTLAVYTGSRVDALTELAGDFAGYGRRKSRVVLEVTGGTVYKLRVAGWNYKQGDIVLNWNLATPPPNDLFSDATTISGRSGRTTGTNVEATVETGEPGPETHSVWWQWQAPLSGTVTIDTIGSDFDTTLGVYTGTRVDALTRLAENDYGNGQRSRVVLDVTVGTVYRLRVAGFNEAMGNIVLNWNLETAYSRLFVPIVLRTKGHAGSFFTSEMTLTNRGTTSADIHYTYTATYGRGTGTATDSLEAGQQRIIPDAIAYLTALGLPIGSGLAGGTLMVDLSNLSSPSGAAVTVRVSTPVEEGRGRAGLAYFGLNPDGLLAGPAIITGLRQNQQDRSNLAVQNAGDTSDGSITLKVTVFAGDSASAGKSMVMPDLSLPPGGFHQYNGILNRAGFDNGYVKVERIEGTAPFYTYGVINDNFNSDGSFVFPVREDSLVGKRGQTLPVIIETGTFASELTVTNFSPVTKTVDFSFVAQAVQTANQTARFRLRLQAGQQGIIPHIVNEMRQHHVLGVGPAGPSFVGAVFAAAAEGDMSGVVIGARTGSPDKRGGQYGLFYNGVPYGLASVDSAWIYGLQQNENNRSNLALINTGEIDDSSSTFEITIHDGSGKSQPRIKTVTLAPRRWTQENGILGTISQGYVQVRKVSGNNPFIAYGVINDGGRPGERSGDGAFLLSQE